MIGDTLKVFMLTGESPGFHAEFYVVGGGGGGGEGEYRGVHCMHTGKCIQKQDIVVLAECNEGNMAGYLSEGNMAGYLVRASGVGRVQ